jgi:flagellar biosynthesis/type III secretory pathway M-ring protein FliF/YscJ
MNLIIANAFPVAGVWLYAFMAAFALILIPVFPFILRRRRRRAHKELHEKIEKAKSKILEDGVVTIPKGPHARHIPWGSRMRSPTGEAGPPKHKAYHGGPWR